MALTHRVDILFFLHLLMSIAHQHLNRTEGVFQVEIMSNIPPPPQKKNHISNLHSKVSWNSQLQGGNDPHKSPGYNS